MLYECNKSWSPETTDTQKQLAEQSQRAQVDVQVQEGREAAAMGADKKASEDREKLENIERELKAVKGEFYLERQSFDQRLATEAERTHRAEREREVAREEVEQMHLAEQIAREAVQRLQQSLAAEKQMREEEKAAATQELAAEKQM